VEGALVSASSSSAGPTERAKKQPFAAGPPKKKAKKAAATGSEKEASADKGDSGAAVPGKLQMPFGANFTRQDYKKNGRMGVNKGNKDSKFYKKYYNSNGTMKRKYSAPVDQADDGGGGRRTYKAMRLASFAREALATKTMVKAPLVSRVERDPAFSALVTSSLLKAAEEAAVASGGHFGLGNIAGGRPPDAEADAEVDDTKPQEDASTEAAPEAVPQRLLSLPPVTVKAPADYTAEDLNSILRHTCGHEVFRPGQQEAISSLLAGKKTLLLLATGSGKSLCYQIPAYLLREEGLTLVVSPLVSLMADQLRRLPRNLRLRGAIVSGQQTRDEVKAVMRAVRARLIDVLFISPERLAMWSFDGCGLPPIALACIDEAHCVSEWSHNFRPDYLRLHEFLTGSLGAKRLLALTATATRPTIESVTNILRIESIVRSDRSFVLKELLEEPAQPRVQRENLSMDVKSFLSEEAQAQELINILRSPEVCKHSAIVYVWRRAETHELSNRLSSLVGGRVRPYHGSMPPEERRRVQDAFMDGLVRVVVATMAFGMGLDKPDIRTVIHMGCPKSIENYIQETGRCSRDGQPGRCIALLAPQTYKSMRWMESGKGGNGAQAGLVRRLLDMLIRRGEESKKSLHHSYELSDQAMADLDREDDGSVPAGPIAGRGEVPAGWRPYHVAFEEREVSQALNCPTDELHSALAHFAFRAKGHVTLFSRFPTKLKLRFFKTDAAELAEHDPLLRKVLPLAKKSGPVHTIETARALALLGGKAGQLSNALWQAQGNEFAVEKTDYGYMISVLRPVTDSDVEAWAEDISLINSRARKSSIEKLDAVYIALQKAAEASRNKAKAAAAAPSDAPSEAVVGPDELLNSLIDAYFAALSSSPSAAVAGGEAERARLLRDALGEGFEVGGSSGSAGAGRGRGAGGAAGGDPQGDLSIRQEVEGQAVYSVVARLVLSPEWPKMPSNDDRVVARLVAQFLAAIDSLMMPARKWRDHRCWGKFRTFPDFQHLEDLVYHALLRLWAAQRTAAAASAAASATSGVLPGAAAANTAGAQLSNPKA